MNNYVGVKLIKAEPMLANEAGRVLQRPIDVSNTDEQGDGYLVEYPDGYKSWSPKEQFEKSYIRVGNDNKIEEHNVRDFVKTIEFSKWGEKTTVAHATLANGFILTESSSCVDAANYSQGIGEAICRENIYNRVWSFLGFLLQCGVNGIKG